jgi:hypothetical protein
MHDLRGIAAIVAQSELNNDSPIAWAMLVEQLGRALRAIGDAHAVRGETEMAKVLVGNLFTELEVLHDRFETSSSRELAAEAQTFEERVAVWRPEGAGITLDIEEDLDLNLDLHTGLER